LHQAHELFDLASYLFLERSWLHKLQCITNIIGCTFVFHPYSWQVRNTKIYTCRTFVTMTVIKVRANVFEYYREQFVILGCTKGKSLSSFSAPFQKYNYCFLFLYNICTKLCLHGGK
jgi:hypothetical protein